MKSTSHGISMWRIRSARKKTAPLSTPTSSRSRSAYSMLTCSPSVRTLCLRSSGWTRISPIFGSRMGARTISVQHPAGQTGSLLVMTTIDHAGALAMSDPQTLTDERVARRALQVARRTALGVLGDSATAADIAQEVAITAVRRAASLRDPAALDAWLHRIAVRAAL